MIDIILVYIEDSFLEKSPPKKLSFLTARTEYFLWSVVYKSIHLIINPPSPHQQTYNPAAVDFLPFRIV